MFVDGVTLTLAVERTVNICEQSGVMVECKAKQSPYSRS